MSNKHDKIVLEAIFNPFLPSLEFDDETTGDENTENKELSEKHKAAEEMEYRAIELANKGQLKGSLNVLTQAIDLAPDKASCYNNRAQALQLIGNIPGAIQDLKTAIDLTNGMGPLAGKAFCQRAIINRLLGHEKESLEDFKRASELGNAFAKSHLAKMNPYAALCNQMLTEMMSGYKG